MSNQKKEIKRVKSTEYIGWICWEEDEIDDHFFPSVKDLIEYCKDRGVPVPNEVNGCYKVGISVNVENVLESALQGLYEDARSSIPKAEIVKLQELLDKWCAVQTVATSFKDSSVVVEIDTINPGNT